MVIVLGALAALAAALHSSGALAVLVVATILCAIVGVYDAALAKGERDERVFDDRPEGMPLAFPRPTSPERQVLLTVITGNGIPYDDVWYLPENNRDVARDPRTPDLPQDLKGYVKKILVKNESQDVAVTCWAQVEGTTDSIVRLHWELENYPQQCDLAPGESEYLLMNSWYFQNEASPMEVDLRIFANETLQAEKLIPMKFARGEWPVVIPPTEIG
jgi:hypothetical protein